MDKPGTFDGLTDESLQERLPGWLADVEKQQDPAMKAGQMHSLLGSVASRGLLADSSLKIIGELADRTLELELTPRDRMRTHVYKATTIRRANRHKTGDALRTPRREMAMNILLGYRAALDFIEDFDREHPGFDPTSRPTLAGFWNAGGSPEADEMARKGREVNRKWTEAMSGWHMVTDMRSSFHHAENDLIDVYARAPYDLKELGTLAADILGDAKIANRLVAKTNEEIVALAKQGMSKDFKEVEAEIMEMVMEPFDANLLIASAPSTQTIPSAITPAPETERSKATEKSEEPSGSLSPWGITIGVAFLLATIAAIGLRKRKQA